ncbi:hypothetical protein [Hespellia stercorisuis]|uniref:Uncharacterized protein n=1 Tax=Hespellia stercorisuis DSM 15480 TaxID=1121950 RepID=A0A1M6X0I7_9FIRM|nr:hypothetical protein [Hespellia stercorisuis]SHK99434.1 hypothetical protein SAMN02745243_04136 [Hespellia stercorisuis DSM 15480]
MADIKLNRIADCIEHVELIDNYRMTKKDFDSLDELSDCYLMISYNLFYMNQFGIISNFEYIVRLRQLVAWYRSTEKTL